MFCECGWVAALLLSSGDNPATYVYVFGMRCLVLGDALHYLLVTPLDSVSVVKYEALLLVYVCVLVCAQVCECVLTLF